MSRLGKRLDDLLRISSPSREVADGFTSALKATVGSGQFFDPERAGREVRVSYSRSLRMRLAWYSARRDRAEMRANIAEALKPHADRRHALIVEMNPEDGRRPQWCDCCAVPYPCHTRRMLTRPRMGADQ